MFSGVIDTATFKRGDVVRDAITPTNIGVVASVGKRVFPKNTYVDYQVVPAGQNTSFLYRGGPYDIITEQASSKNFILGTYLLPIPNGEEWKRQWAILYYIKKTRLMGGYHSAGDTALLNGRLVSTTDLDNYIKQANITPEELLNIKFDDLYWHQIKSLGSYKPFTVVKARGRFGVIIGGLYTIRRIDGSSDSVMPKDVVNGNYQDTIRKQVLYVLSIPTFSPLLTAAVQKLDKFEVLTVSELEALQALTTVQPGILAVSEGSPLIYRVTGSSNQMAIIYDSNSNQQMVGKIDSIKEADNPKLDSGVTFGLALLGGASGVVSTVVYNLFFAKPETKYVIYTMTLLTGDKVGAIESHEFGGSLFSPSSSSRKWEGGVSVGLLEGYLGTTIDTQFTIVKSLYAMFGSTPEIEAAGNILSQGKALTDGQMATVKRPLTDTINSQLEIIKSIKAVAPTSGTGLIATYEAKLLRGEPLTQAEGKYLEDTWTSFVSSSVQYAQVKASIPAMISTSVVTPTATPTTSVVPIVNIATQMKKPIVSVPKVSVSQVTEMVIAPELIYAGIGLALFILIW